MTLAVQQAVRALLETSTSTKTTSHSTEDQTFSSAFADNEDDTPLEASQGQLCERVVQSIDQWEKSPSRGEEEDSDDDEEVSNYEKHTTRRSSFLQTPQDAKITIRSIMGDSNQVSELPQMLAHLISNRVDTADIMPLTYDAQANEEAMSSSFSAMTLTRPAMAAAELYAKLVSMPGALGSGLVEMQALGALAALLRRWRTECCGREAAGMDNSDATATTIAHKKNKNTVKRNQSARQVAVDDESDDDDEEQPLKRLRQSATRSKAVSKNSENEDDDSPYNTHSQLVVEEVGVSAKLSSSQLLIMGLRIARQVCEIPLQREFLQSWSTEAREAVMDAVTGALATAAALMAGRTAASNKSQTMIMSLASTVVHNASQALQTCILESRTTDDDREDDDDEDSNGSENLTKRHETAVSMLRGIFPILTTKDVLPKGESGKQAACSAAAKVLENFVKEVTDDMKMNRSRWPRSMTTPARRMSVHAPRPITPNEDGEAVTPKTSRRKKRQSVGSAMKERRLETPVTPKIKSPKTPAPSSSAAYTGRPRPVLSAVLGALQKLATAKGLEKASTRHSTVQTLHVCVCHLPMLERSHFLKFLIQMCHSKVSVHRLVGSELVGLILSEEWLWSEHTKDFMVPEKPATPESRRKSLSPLVMRSSEDMPAALFGALQGRLLDRVPAIRAATAFAFANVFGKLLHANRGNVATLSAMGLTEAISAESLVLVDCLRKRAAVDDKATVRRAVVGALVSLLLIGETVESVPLSITDGDIAIVCELGQDTSMLTRKAAADALTLLLQTYESIHDKSPVVLESLEKAWCKSVLPLALDSESSCNSKAVELVDRVLFGPLFAANNDGKTSSSQTAWNILAAVGDGSGQQGASRSDAEALRAVVANKVASPDTSKAFLSDLIKAVHRMIVRTLDDSIGNLFVPSVDSQRAGSWSLFKATMEHSKDLSEITRVIKRSKIDLEFLGTSWDKMLAMSLSSDTPSRSAPALRASMRKCLQVLSKLASCADVSLAQRTAKNLQELLSKFSLPPDIIGSAITALVATTISSYPDNDQKRHREACAAFISDIYRACEDEISSHVGSVMTDDRVKQLLRAFFTVGELSMVGFSSDDDKSSGVLTSGGLVQTDVVRGLYERPSGHLVELVQTFLPNFLPNSVGTPTPETLRAHAFITIGKLCLRNENLAKKCLNFLARELHENMKGGSPTVQSNALLVLGDLCVKYTNMVDRYLPVMAACMQSGITDINNNVLAGPASNGSALVRKHAVLLLSSLLLQEYLKWRGLLFQRFLVASADEDEDVARLAELVLCGPLITKQPKLFFNQFVESIFVLNRCTAHPVYQAAASLGDGGSGISVGFDGINLTGEVGRVRRLSMYQMMLSKMTDEEKIGVTARLTKEILGGALEGGSDLNMVCISSSDSSSPESRPTAKYESALNVLSDALTVLSSPQIRVGKSVREASDNIEDPNMPNMSKRIIVARGQLLSKISRKHLIEIILPILCSLKVVLQKSCSRLLKDLMSYLVDVFRMYKLEVKEFLANDLSLLQEIEYDARQFKKAQRFETPGKGRSFALTNEDDE